MKHVNLDVQGQRPACIDAGELCMDGKAWQTAWKERYESFSND